MERRTVLVSAYACEPEQGSEPGVGWNTVVELAKYHDVWVLTTRHHRRAIETYLETHAHPNLHFVYLDPLGWTYDWSVQKSRWDLNIHYYLWQIEAFRLARKLHATEEFDLVHHVTYVRYWTPSFLALLPAPFIFGTVGGGEATPEPFMASFSLRNRLFEHLRQGIQRLSEFDPFVRTTAQRSRLAIAATQETEARLELIGACTILIQDALGLSEGDTKTLDIPPPLSNKGICFLSIGRLVHWKGFHLGLEAFARADLSNASYWIIGDGPEKEHLENLARKLGVAERVTFFGALSRAEVLRQFAHVDVLVHPSLHDSGGMVCLEAMAASRPVVCLNLGGPAVQVTKETGIKVAATSLNETINNLKDALISLAENPDKRLELGRAGRQRILQNYTWKIKGQKIVQLYETVLREA